MVVVVQLLGRGQLPCCAQRTSSDPWALASQPLQCHPQPPPALPLSNVLKVPPVSSRRTLGQGQAPSRVLGRSKVAAGIVTMEQGEEGGRELVGGRVKTQTPAPQGSPDAALLSLKMPSTVPTYNVTLFISCTLCCALTLVCVL